MRFPRLKTSRFCIRLLVLVFVAGASSGPATMTINAQTGAPGTGAQAASSGPKFLTGQELEDLWKAYLRCARGGADCEKATLYASYLLGAFDGFEGQTRQRISPGQIESIVGKFIDLHPELARENAAMIVAGALRLTLKKQIQGGSYKTGKELIELLRKAGRCRENPKGAGCSQDLLLEARQYPRGVFDALLGQGRLPNCIDQDCTAGGLDKTVAKYLEDHPDKWSLGAGIIVNEALTEAFPPKK